jgi:hypothetical protein
MHYDHEISNNGTRIKTAFNTRPKYGMPRTNDQNGRALIIRIMTFSTEYLIRLCVNVYEVAQRGVVTGMWPALTVLCVVGMSPVSWSQQVAVGGLPVTSTTSAPAYLATNSVSFFFRDPLKALGDRLQVPGKERLTASGTYSDKSGAQAIVVTWQLPGKLRIQFVGMTSRTLIFDGASTTANGGPTTSEDDDVLESLADDRTETLFWGQKLGSRFLGSHFRTDDGKTKSYSGPYYDIHQLVYRVSCRSDKPIRTKLFYFDSTTELLVKSRYTEMRNGNEILVETAYSGWSQTASQSVPGQIVRRENGAVVFTIMIASAQIGPAVADSTFTQP